MGEFSIWHWLIVGVIVMMLFGKGKISDVMGDVAKGIKSFKKSMAEDDKPAPSGNDAVKAIDHPDHNEAPPSETARQTESVAS